MIELTMLDCNRKAHFSEKVEAEAALGAGENATDPKDQAQLIRH